jgi:hypothetical protein
MNPLTLSPGTDVHCLDMDKDKVRIEFVHHGKKYEYTNTLSKDKRLEDIILDLRSYIKTLE